MFRGNRRALVERRISEGFDYIRKSDPIRIVHMDPFYFIVLYTTVLMIGIKGASPFAFNLHGWSTRTTLDLVRSFGFSVHREKRLYDTVKNRKTNRWNKIYYRPLCLNGNIIDENTWIDGRGMPCGYNYSTFAALSYVTHRIKSADPWFCTFKAI